MKHSTAGFTMVELLTCVALISTVTAFALPGMQSLLTRQQLSSARAELHTALMLARSEALDRGQRVALCPSSDAQRCNNSRQWASGYLLFVDLDDDRQRQPSEPILRVMDAHAQLRITSNVGRPVVIFHPNGSAAGFNTTLSLCALGNSQPAQTLVLSNSGRLRSGVGAACSS
jgi:type IV fimbrial biogenesis protein FimT